MSPRRSGEEEGLTGADTEANLYPNAAAEVVECVCQAASQAGSRAKPPYQETRKNEAFEIMQHGEFVYIPQTIDVGHGDVTFNYGAATMKYKPAFDGFPGASVHYPWAKPQWQTELFHWIHGAGMDFADLASDIGLCMSLLIDSEYTVVPDHFKQTYIGFTLLTIIAEICVASVDVRIRDGPWLTRLRRRYGYPAFLKAAVKSVFVRYTGCPYQVDHAARLFSTDAGGFNIGTEFELPIERERSRSLHDYSLSICFLTKTPKVILEDGVLLYLNLFMMHALKTVTAGGIISAFFSIWCLGVHLLKWCKYILAVRRLTRSLRSRVAHGDISAARGSATSRERQLDGSGIHQLEELLAHPVRRCIAGTAHQ